MPPTQVDFVKRPDVHTTAINSDCLKPDLQGVLNQYPLVTVHDVEDSGSDQDSSVSELFIFEPLEARYEPRIDWLDGSQPNHPQFDHADRIQTIINDIKSEILDFMLEACGLLLAERSSQEAMMTTYLISSLQRNPTLWKAMLSAQHYQVIYFINRLEARETFRPAVLANPVEAHHIDVFLRHNSTSIRCMNYAVHAYINRGHVRADHAQLFVPPNAIASIGSRHVVVREANFARPWKDVMAETAPLWDLHDFAHLTTATLCPELFGNKYQTDLAPLPKPLTALVRSPGMKTARGPKISDGLVFSELLTPVFEEEVEKDNKRSYSSLTRCLAEMLADYLMSRRSLKHLTTSQELRLEAPVTPVQLAVLVQNKAYELPASEIEQRVFVRGGPAHGSSERDVLLNMTARERIEYLAESRSWLYYEVRNTIKHRAHKMAYIIVAEELLQNTADHSSKELLHQVLRNARYEDWQASERVNLWSLVL